MKIAYLSTFYPFRGGIAQFNANLYRALAVRHEVIPFTFERQYPDFLFPGKTQYVTPDDKAAVIESVPVLDTANPLGYGAAARRIAREQPDILVMKYWMSYFAPSLGYVAGKLKKQGCRVITVLDNVIPHEQKFFDRPLTRWFLHRNSGFIAMSEAVRNDLLALEPEAACLLKAHPLYNHFGEKTNPQEARRALGLDPAKKTVLFFGLIRDYKGLDLLIEAMNRLDEGYQLLIAGESYGSFAKYDAQIRQAKRLENIRVFNWYIPDEEVPLFFSAADVCVLPYKSATQSGITSIAYHFDVPLIATDTGGLKESIGAQGTGLIVPEASAPAIAAAIEAFYGADRHRFVQSIGALKTSLSWENFAEALIRFAGTL
ncbi:MAG: glycosyltransferase [Parabacteroides sp.]|nr:glycosyltransferase [Parabacteroides sp.]